MYVKTSESPEEKLGLNLKMMFQQGDDTHNWSWVLEKVTYQYIEIGLQNREKLEAENQLGGC